MKKELLISLLALLTALVAALGVWQRDETLAFADNPGSAGCVSGIGSMVSGTNPGAWVVVDGNVYLLKADYDYNSKQWTIRQVASVNLTH